MKVNRVTSFRGGVVLAGVLVALLLGEWPISADRTGQQPSQAEAGGAAVSADTALARLKSGNARFVVDDPAGRARYPDQRRRLAKSQKPCAVVLTCADSRVVPELIFDQQLGELFVVRVAGNVTDPVVLGSIEYAAEHLNCPLVVVLGHQRCGAVKAAVDAGHLEGNLRELVGRVYVGPNLKTLFEETKNAEEAIDVAVRLNVRHQVRELSGKSGVLKKLVADKKLQVAGAVYSLDTGRVEWLKAPQGSFPGRDGERRASAQ
jgi:carbonic anhydrase